MTLKVLQKKLVKNFFDYSQRHNIKVDQDLVTIKLFEEVGEFAQALLIHQKRCRESKYTTSKISQQELGKELADVIGLALVNAHILGIDIEKAIDEKWIHKKK